MNIFTLLRRMREPVDARGLPPRAHNPSPAFLAICIATVVVWLASCAAPRYPVSGDELEAFKAAGPIAPEFDEDKLLEAVAPSNQYRIVAGDVLVVKGPFALLGRDLAGMDRTQQRTSIDHFVRVSENGTVEIPTVGAVEAAGKTVLELEDAIANAAHPKFLKQRPSIVVTLEEPFTVAVTVFGAVTEPGIHRLPSDEMTLSGALSAAGGIAKSGNLVVGAQTIKIYSADSDPDVRKTILPIRGLNVPFYDVPLEGGERIEVERYEPDRFTVVGLVIKPGAYEYPPEKEINLLQALSIAGGVDRISDPPFATVFRKKLDTGEILPATFEIKGNGLAEASALRIKPGDVIAVDHTAGSWTRSFMAQVFRLNFGVFLDSRRLQD